MRLVACDLDGTVVPPDGTMSGRTLAAFDACRSAGVDIVFVTGRPPRWMAPVVSATRPGGLAICANGAILLDLVTGAVLEVNALAPGAVIAVADRLRPVLPGATFALETLDGYRREPGYAVRNDRVPPDLTGELSDLLADSPTVVKMLCRLEGVPPMRADDMLAAARTALTGVAEPVHSNPDGGMLEISAPGVSKASALERLATGRGIPAADVVAFGDMPNDVPMLRWAGRAFAMAGGHPEAVAAAGEIAPPCREDGVAQVLEALLAAELAPAEDR